jgi:hypothetical protein
MSPLRFAVALVVSLAAAASAQGRLQPTTPDTVREPAWQGTIHLADGRTFVSDGGLAVEATIAKPATLPPRVLPETSSRALEGHLGRKNAKEIGLGDLKPAATKNTFVTADGIGLNGNYVAFLRRAAPKARLRTDGPRDPIVIVVDGRPVGALMPFVLSAPK